MISPWTKLSNVLLLPEVCGKIVFTFCLFIIFSPVATEVERDKLASSEFSVKKKNKAKKKKSKISHTLTKLNTIISLMGEKKKKKSRFALEYSSVKF